MYHVELCPVLVGRDTERSILVRLLEESTRGAGATAFVLGQTGIGKSRLVAETAVEATRQGLTVLRGRATETSSPAPFRPFGEALLGFLRKTGETKRLAVAPEVRPFLPALGKLVPAWRQSAAEVGDDSIVVLGEALLHVLRLASAGHGAVLILEDVHWADTDTLSVLEYLSDNAAGEPVLCVVTIRDNEPSAALRVVRSLQRRRATTVLELTRLSAAGVAEMARACLGTLHLSEAVTTVLAASADGVPLLIEELLASAIDKGSLVQLEETWEAVGALAPAVPVTFRESVERRLQPLGDCDRSVLHAAAVLGRHFDWTLLSAITGVEEDILLAALRRATRAQVLTVDDMVDGTRFRFRHALIREAVLDDLLPAERMALAARALAALETTFPELPDERVELAAELAQQAGDGQRAAELLLRSGQQALRAGALATAEAMLDRACHCSSQDPERRATIAIIDELQDVSASIDKSLIVVLGRAAATANMWKRAEDYLAQARALAPDGLRGTVWPQIDAVAAVVAVGDHRSDEAAARAQHWLVLSEKGSRRSRVKHGRSSDDVRVSTTSCTPPPPSSRRSHSPRNTI